jgi:hypothetical protein
VTEPHRREASLVGHNRPTAVQAAVRDLDDERVLQAVAQSLDEAARRWLVTGLTLGAVTGE